MDRTNARYLEHLPEPVDLVVIDVSFISLHWILPRAVAWLRPSGGPSGDGARIVALIKPQFEAGRDQVGKGGVVRDPEVHRAVLEKVLAWARELELGLLGLIRSPIVGPAGNVEFLAGWLVASPDLTEGPQAIEHVLETA
jgi:23S rRNA (cytidine1920-2'-O)/16S rRNA (cytidine1409-2'-O)-methyltransferase